MREKRDSPDSDRGAPKPSPRRCRIPESSQGTPALVGIVTRKKDWEILETRQWYRIPQRTAPEGLERIAWLAFYQTRAFADRKWSVTCCAPVMSMKLMTRRELLPDEPAHKRAEDGYYRIEIGELQALPRPIPSLRWRRIVFIPTTLERLHKAEEINDLFVSSPIEDRLYGALRSTRLQPVRQYLVRETGQPGHMLDLAVFCRDGLLDIECDGDRYHLGRERAAEDRTRDNRLTVKSWRILRFNGTEINRDLDDCVRLVRRTVRRLGGPDLQGKRSGK